MDKHGGGHALWDQRIEFFLCACVCVCVHFNYDYVYVCIVSSPYLFVIGDDHVIRYTGAYDVAGSASEA